MIRRRTITSYVWNSVSGNKMVILSNCIRNFFRKFELLGNSVQGENPAPDNPKEIKSAGKWNEEKQKYEISVKVTGKNLLNLQKEPDVKGVYQGWKVGDGEKTIVLSIKDKGNNVDITKCSIGVSGNGINSNDGLGWIVQDGVIKRSEIKTINPYVSIYPSNKTSVQKFLERFDIQAEYGVIATPYEPYTEQSVQIALDEPLRGIGEYKDVLTKDGVVRRIKRTVFDGSEDEKWGIGIERENVIDFVSTQFSDATKINEHQRSMMDKLKWSSGVWGRDEIGQDMFARILRINMPKTLAPDLQTFKTWLSQNPLIVDYVLAEPVTEPLPESVQAQLQALHSENGTTHVFVDSGEVEAGINIKYKYKS